MYVIINTKRDTANSDSYYRGGGRDGGFCGGIHGIYEGCVFFYSN